MMKLGSLIRHMFPHRAWPYPRGEQEIRQAIVVALCIVLFTLTSIVIGLKYQDEKTLKSSDIHFAAKNMTNYSSEAYLLVTKSHNQPLFGPYRQVYIQQLADDVSEIKDKLTTHKSAEDIHQEVSQLTNICDQLRDILDTFIRDPSDQVLTAHAKELHQLTKRAKAIEETTS